MVVSLNMGGSNTKPKILESYDGGSQNHTPDLGKTKCVDDSQVTGFLMKKPCLKNSLTATQFPTEEIAQDAQENATQGAGNEGCGKS